MGVDKFRRDGEIAELLVCGDGLKGRHDSLRSKWRATRLQLEGRGRHVKVLAERSAARWQARVASISLGTLGRNGGVGYCRHRSAQVPRAKISRSARLDHSENCCCQYFVDRHCTLTLLCSTVMCSFSRRSHGMNDGWCFPADEEPKEEPYSTVQYCTQRSMSAAPPQSASCQRRHRKIYCRAL